MKVMNIFFNIFYKFDDKNFLLQITEYDNFVIGFENKNEKYVTRNHVDIKRF